MSASSGTALVPSTDRDVPTAFQGTLEPNYYCRGWNAKRQKYCRARAGAKTEHPGVGRCRNHAGSSTVTHGRYAKIQREELRALVAHYEADPDPLNVLGELALARALLVDFVNRYGEITEALLAWHASYDVRQRQLSPLLEESFRALVDEHEELVKGSGEDATPQQLERLEEARRFVAQLRRATDEGKPRRILDISDAIGHVEVISKVIDRVVRARAENAISRADLFRVMTQFGLIIDRRVSDAALKQQIGDDILAIRL